jgi:hypothetical protein
MNSLTGKMAILLLVSTLALPGCTSTTSSQQATPPLSEVEIPAALESAAADKAACSKYQEVLENLATSAQSAGAIEVEHLTTAAIGIFDARRNPTNYVLGLQLEAWEKNLRDMASELRGFGSISTASTIDFQNNGKTLSLACD